MKRRKPWIAFTFSLFCPGLGQLYNGNLRWAAMAFVLGASLAILTTFFFFSSMAALMSAMFVGLGLDIFFAIQALREARVKKEMVLKPYQNWWAYLLFALVMYGVPDGYGLWMPTRLMSFQIPSESMLPNLVIGDRLVADGWAFWRGEPKRGEIVVFDYPRDPSLKYVKRLIGLPGDVVELKGGELFINGEKVEQTLAPRDSMSERSENFLAYRERIGDIEYSILRALPGNNEDFGPITVPEGKYFMLGDNRDRSNDSRVWGFVDRRQLIARMQYIYFSWDGLSSRIRKDRLGLHVK